MRPNQLLQQTSAAVLHASFMFLLLPAMTLNAQPQTDFSGRWELDKTASRPDVVEPDYDGTVILEIAQSTATISFAETYVHPGRPDWTTAAESYSVDGKEQVRKDDIGTNRRSAKWSQDKKVLTITNVDTEITDGVTQEFLVADSLELSGDGLTLTIDRRRKNPVTGETTARKVYRKK